MSNGINRLIRETNPPSGSLASPTPQYLNPTTGEPETVRGSHGAPFSQLLGPDGAPINRDNPLEVRVRELEGELQQVRQLLEEGNAKVQLSGQDDDIDVAVAADNTRLTSPPTTGTKTVTSTAAELFAGSSRRQGRAFVTVRNLDIAARIRIGPSSVTDETGFGVDPGAVVTLPIDPKSDVPVYAVSEAGDVEVEVLEG